VDFLVSGRALICLLASCDPDWPETSSSSIGRFANLSTVGEFSILSVVSRVRRSEILEVVDLI
jgi:hypothetical protein